MILYLQLQLLIYFFLLDINWQISLFNYTVNCYSKFTHLFFQIIYISDSIESQHVMTYRRSHTIYTEISYVARGILIYTRSLSLHTKLIYYLLTRKTHLLVTRTHPQYTTQPPYALTLWFRRGSTAQRALRATRGAELPQPRPAPSVPRVGLLFLRSLLFFLLQYCYFYP